MKDNMALWHTVEKTDPRRTKEFSGKGGFKGTAINPMYMIRRATELWGPMGGKWGIRIIAEKLMPGAPLLGADGQVVGEESVHVVQIEIFYPDGALPAFGQTTFVGKNKYGFFTDEEAPKKSLTDALTKGLSWLGFSADVHSGLYDDVKYVNRVLGEFEAEDRNGQGKALRDKALAVLKAAVPNGLAGLEFAWRSLTDEARQACKLDLAELKKEAEHGTPAA